MWRYPDIPILARPDIFPALEAEGGWLCQLKYNGWRCIVEWNGKAVTYTSRHKKGLAQAVAPEIAAETLEWISGLPPGTTFDAELLGRRDDVTVKGLVIFDVLSYGGLWQGAKGTQQRLDDLWAVRDALNQRGGRAMQLVECQTIGFAAMFEAARDNPQVEGVVLKRAAAPYIGSVRQCAENPGWLKVKFRGGEDGNQPVA